MKIGIVTYHRTLNYGACLQALATRVILENEGYEVYYVDYWPQYHQDLYNPWSWTNIRSRLRSPLRLCNYIVKNIKYRTDVKKRKQNFESYFSSYIYPYCLSEKENYDVIIYGSDQIWRKQAALKAYNPFYFGMNELAAVKHVSYAASMGILPHSSKDKSILKDFISHLDFIGVREEGLLKLVKELGFVHAQKNIDPTLLLTSKQWDELLTPDTYDGEPYVLVYSFENNPFNMDSVSKFAKERSLKIIMINGYAFSKETESNFTTCGPSEFVRLIKYADYVFSASFHGTVFSILYEKQVIASNKGNSERMKSLFESLEIYDRLLYPFQEIPTDLPQIDYARVHLLLDSYRKDSYDYLIHAIKA